MGTGSVPVGFISGWWLRAMRCSWTRICDGIALGGEWEQRLHERLPWVNMVVYVVSLAAWRAHYQRLYQVLIIAGFVALVVFGAGSRLSTSTCTGCGSTRLTFARFLIAELVTRVAQFMTGGPAVGGLLALNVAIAYRAQRLFALILEGVRRTHERNDQW